ncbi:MAG TPA: roadblock/LC7 domain-containing protein [Streptomyces sp.]|uniref:roadblock/LC7 domain-containing protein n=1 Tax=Streptomyces sp. TaxID=1931 RepID=UPI002C5EB813|nr:roadblock/LC7 domain-containing protein [Streptomyces sp.]HWU12229.1 roadblock/LC7 domain-containing protein [Streptomyces sp.]
MAENQYQQPTADSHDMSWFLNQIAREKGVLHALLLTDDGLKLAVSEGLDSAVADRTAASAAAAFSVGKSIAEFASCAGTKPKKIVFDLDDTSIFIFGAGHGTSVIVSVTQHMTSKEAVTAASAAIKAIAGLRPALSARARTARGTT